MSAIRRSLTRRRHSKSIQNHWQCEALERRLLLAADMAAASSTPVTALEASALEATALEASANQEPSDCESPEVTITRQSIVFVDSGIENFDALTASLSPDAELHLIPEQCDAIQYISRVLDRRSDIQSVHLVSHGKPGAVMLGGQEIDAAVIRQRAGDVARWSKSLTPTADILIYGCDVAADPVGLEFVDAMALITGRDVAASNDKTGHASFAADWELEQATGNIESSLAFSTDVAERFDSYLAISIRAAGVTGEEQMQLQIDGATVATYNNVGGNAYGGVFQTYTYNTSENIASDRVRIQFTNDLYVPGGVDRNLRVDNITISGVTYETEAPTVFSTGTWLPADGVTAGYRQSEYLHANGYFQYASPTGTQGSLIEIFAAGETGAESMELRINDQVVQTWNNVGGNTSTPTYQSYLFRASGTVTPDQLKVAFTNDFYANGVDRNLRVDKLIIDGVTYQIEAPTVYSTGTWKAADGIQPGFRQSEFLHANGYFQLQQSPIATPGVISLQSSTFNVSENSGAVLINVVRAQGSSGTVTVDYSTLASSAVANSDYGTTSGTLTFAPGETIKTVSVPILNDLIGESNESFSFAIDNVNGGATLLAPRTAIVTIVDDDIVLANFPTFTSTPDIKLKGTASIASGNLNLNIAVANASGSAYFKNSVPVTDSTSFQSNFRFNLSAATSLPAGSGLLFVIQNSAAGTSAYNPNTGALGYQGLERSIAIQFDTRLLTSGTNQNFVKLLVNGNLTPIQSAQTPLVQYVPNSTAYAWVEYNGASNQLNVYVSTTNTKPTAATLTATIDLPTLLGNYAYFGFSAGAGVTKTVNTVRNWTVNLEQPTTNGGGGAAGLVSETVVGGLSQPIAIDWSPDARNLYVAQKSGLVYVIRDGIRLTNPVIDLQARVNNNADRGLLSVAIHPDLANNPYMYLLYTYDPPEVNNNIGNPLAGPDGAGNRAGRLMRVTLNAATNYTTVVAGSEVILLGTNSVWANFNGFVDSTVDDTAPPAGVLPDGSNLQDFIASDSRSHSVGSLSFGPDGALYVSIGDGSSYNRVDSRAARVQDIDNLSGKLLRINPITGAGLTDNPFYNGDPNANQSKVYQYGFRNPFRFSIDPRNGKVYVGDVGWTNWEEINSGAAGANFGWPFYEGNNLGNAQTNGYNTTAAGQAFYASGIQATPPLIALNHSADNINAIIGGDVYVGNAYPAQYVGDIFFNDLGQGIVRNASLDANGNVTDIQVFATDAAYVVQIIQGPDGRLYYVDLDDGLIGRWSIV